MFPPKKIIGFALGLTLAAGLAIPPLFGSAGQEKIPAALSLETILRELATYDGGLASDAVWKLRDFVQAAKDAPEARLACEERLLAFLGTKASPAAKMAVCRELRIVGGERSVPVLEKMLLDKDVTDMARFALENIPGAEADKALVRALAGAKGEIRLGLVAALGRRKARPAVPELIQFLRSLDPELAKAAALSLGEIGGEDARDSLLAILPTAWPELRETVASSLMRTAEGLFAAGDPASSARIYEKLVAEKMPPPVRLAAMRGKIASAGDKAAALILETLAGPDPLWHEAAIGAIKAAFPANAIADVTPVLSRLPAESQVKLLAVLSEYPRDRVLATIRQAAGSETKDVRIAALRALEKTGDATTVTMLAQTAATTTGAEQAAARTALWGLKGQDVDAAILDALAAASDANIQAELVRSVGERRIYAGKDLAFRLASSPSARVQTQAVRAIRVIGTPSDVAGMLDFLLASDNEAARRDMENAIVGLAQKVSRPDGRSATVKARLSREKDPKTKAVLFRVLGRIGDDSALATLRRSLQDKNADLVDAAARALFGWPSASAKDDVFAIAKTAANPTHKILALQAYVRMTGLEKYRAPAAATGDLKKALKLASRPEEKRLVLGLLPNFSCPDSLKLAATLLTDEDVAAEAKLALNKIKTQLEQDAKQDAERG